MLYSPASWFSFLMLAVAAAPNFVLALNFPCAPLDLLHAIAAPPMFLSHFSLYSTPRARSAIPPQVLVYCG
jgi:hypothetical protein